MTFVRARALFRKDNAFDTLFGLVIHPRSSSLDHSKQDKLNKLLQDSISGPFALLNMPKYSKKDFQQIFKTVLEFRTSPPALQPLIFPDKPYKRPLKARFPDLYCGRCYMECYNFWQKCEDQFAIAGAKKQKHIPFAVNFFQDQALF